jgi:diaminopimelate decarboxylase
MFVEDFPHKRALIERLLAEAPAARTGSLDHVVRRALERRGEMLALAERRATPCYVFDEGAFDAALAAFSGAFSLHVPRHRPFYAVKSNHHSLVVRAAVRAGFGLDVSSGRELVQALRGKAERILFSGPAKSEADLELAVQHTRRVVVNLDSFRELALLGRVAHRQGKGIAAGVRIHTGHHGAWSKFGIPLAELPRFWREARGHAGVLLAGIQSHLSWTHDPAPYGRVIDEVAACLRDDFTPEERARVRFYDFGGGYRPHQIEGQYPGELPLGELIGVADRQFGEESRFQAPFYLQETTPLEEYARQIGQALKRHLVPLVDCDFYSEPGRIVSSAAMHLLLRVADKKGLDLVIVDGGIHMVGWERYLHIYAPIVNLTRPALTEIPVRVCGSLCDPEDVFGRFVYCESIEEGDVLLVPNQGAYTYATAQSFIRDVPMVHRLPRRRG